MRALTPQTAQLFAPIRSIRNSDRISLSLTREADHFQARIYSETGEQQAHASRAASQLFVQRIPEKQELHIHPSGIGDWYNFAATDITAAIIRGSWPQGQVKLLNAETQELFSGLLLQGIEQERNADLIARFKSWQDISNRYGIPANEYMAYAPQLFDWNRYEYNPDLPLGLYQGVGLHCCAQSQGFALFMEQGTGKTPVIVSLICNEARERTNDNMLMALVIVPKNVRTNWESEFLRFGTQPGKVTVLRGNFLQRGQCFLDAVRKEKEQECKYSVIIASYEAARKTWPFLQGINYDMGVLDESHYIKSAKAERTKWAMQLRDKCARRYVLTGSPVANNVCDVWAQLEFLGRGWSGFNTLKGFKTFYGEYNTGVDDITSFSNLPFMQERLARVSYIVTKKEVLPHLPPIVYDIDEVEMTSEQAATYKDVAEKLYIEAEQLLADETVPRSMRAMNILTKFLRLAQITSGFVCWDEIVSDDGTLLHPKTYDRFDPDPKLERVIELLKEKGPNDKTIVWTCWIPNIKTIRARLELEGIGAVVYFGDTRDSERDAAVAAFNNDRNCKVFIGNPAAGGVGLNLLGYPPGDESVETNCNHEIFYSQGWSMLHRGQAEARAHRRGTREPLRITDLQVTDTIDEEIRKRVTNKRASAASIQDVRGILNRVLEKVRQ